MNYERKELLVAALRSGEFKQGNGRLTTIGKDGTHYDCCLGVACKVAMGHGLPVTTEVIEIMGGSNRGNKMVIYHTTNSSDGSVLPKEVREWYGMQSSSGMIESVKRHDDGKYELTSFNDTGVPFDDIADLIDKHWREL